jgi:hypothetical protein
VSYAKGCAFQADLAAQCADGGPDEVSQSGAYEAAHAAANAVSTIAYKGDEDVALGAVYAAHDAARALFIVLGLGSQPILDDFEHLKASAEKHGWTDETPVPPEFFAPLQPFGEDEEVRREAYDAWERAGRPSLSPQEQGRMYYEALHRVRAARRRAAPSGP